MSFIYRRGDELPRMIKTLKQVIFLAAYSFLMLPSVFIDWRYWKFGLP